MSKEKVLRLTKYLTEMKDKLSNPIPSKHKDHPDNYKRFLNSEISTTSAKIDALKLVEEPKGK